MLSATSFHCLVLDYSRPRPLKVAGRHRSVRVEEEIGFKPADHSAPFTRSLPCHQGSCFLLSNRYHLTVRESYPLGRGPAGLLPLSARASQPGPRAPQSRMERYYFPSFISLWGRIVIIAKLLRFLP
jgi:hypothetical protein